MIECALVGCIKHSIVQPLQSIFVSLVLVVSLPNDNNGQNVEKENAA